MSNTNPTTVTKGQRSGGSHDKEVVRRAAAGRWRDIIPAICPAMTDRHMDGSQQSCPKCDGGDHADRFRVFGDFDETGGTFCNQCGPNNGDGFATILWLQDKNPSQFSEVVNKVGDFLQIAKPEAKPKKKAPAKSGGKFDPDKNLDFSHHDGATFEKWATKWIDKHAPAVTVDALRRAGARFAIYRGKTPCIAMPCKSMVTGEIIGYRLFGILKPLPVFLNHKRREEWSKLSPAGMKAGLFVIGA